MKNRFSGIILSSLVFGFSVGTTELIELYKQPLLKIQESAMSSHIELYKLIVIDERGWHFCGACERGSATDLNSYQFNDGTMAWISRTPLIANVGLEYLQQEFHVPIKVIEQGTITSNNGTIKGYRIAVEINYEESEKRDVEVIWNDGKYHYTLTGPSLKHTQVIEAMIDSGIFQPLDK